MAKRYKRLSHTFMMVIDLLAIKQKAEKTSYLTNLRELPMTQFIYTKHAGYLWLPYSAFWLGLFILSIAIGTCAHKPMWESYWAVA